jgi:hypothetical protein
MSITSDHTMGFAVGLGAAALGFYLYKKNQPSVDAWLRQQGIQVPQTQATDESGMSLEELMTEKERLEDLIAEREAAAKSPEASPAAPK